MLFYADVAEAAEVQLPCVVEWQRPSLTKIVAADIDLLLYIWTVTNLSNNVMYSTMVSRGRAGLSKSER